MAFPAYAFVLIISTTISAVFACGGYQITNLTTTPCDKGEVFVFDNFNVKLTDDCKAIPTGCIKIMKDVEEAEGTYQVKKITQIGPGMTFGGKKKLCSMLEDSKKSDDIQLVLGLLQFPKECPLKAKNMCPKGEMDITKYKDKIKILEGNSNVEIKGKTKGGDEVCMHVQLTISKKGGSAPSIMG